MVREKFKFKMLFYSKLYVGLFNENIYIPNLNEMSIALIKSNLGKSAIKNRHQINVSSS